jgi:hypothetical protein
MSLPSLKTFWALLEAIELTRFIMTWRPLLIFIANFITGWLLTQGYIDPADHDTTAQLIADVLGYFILGITSIFSLVHAFKKPHDTQKAKPVIQQPVATEPKNDQIFTQDFSQNPGTPPSPPLPSN